MANSKDRESRYLSPKQMADLIDAAAFADAQGMPPTRVLHFNLKGLEGRAQEFITSFFKLAGDWLRIKGAPRAYLWVMEHPPGKSLNAHCLVHVPFGLIGEFTRKERRWMKEAGLTWKSGRLKSERIADQHNKAKGPQSAGELLCNIEGLLGYAMKGGLPTACETLKIEFEWQGYVRGKRCGVAQSISRASRDAKGYCSPVGTRSSMLFRWRYKLGGCSFHAC